jgi:hypothetical protein
LKYNSKTAHGDDERKSYIIYWAVYLSIAGCAYYSSRHLLVVHLAANVDLSVRCKRQQQQIALRIFIR